MFKPGTAATLTRIVRCSSLAPLFIHHCRLKRSGAWWLKPNANRMLAIRCAVRNGTFTRLISRHVAFQATLMDI